jgi:response regulator NasT
MNQTLRIAVADDQRDMREFFRFALAQLKHEVVAAAGNGRELVECCRAARPDLVITDVKMPELDGIAAAAAVYRDGPVPAILVTGYDDRETLRQAAAPHVYGYLVKPIKSRDLAPAIQVAMARFALDRAAEQEAAGLRQALEDRKLIERAKGVVMRRLAVEEIGAFRRLRKLSSDRNWKVIEIARQVLKAEEVFDQLQRVGGPR